MPEKFQPNVDKEPHFISSRLLAALSGIKEQTEVGGLVDRGAYLWDVEDREKGAGLFKHVMLASRVAYTLAEELKKKAPERYGSVDLKKVVEAAILHDISKLFAEDRESLSPEQKKVIGIRTDFKESDPDTEDVGVAWLQELGFSKEVLDGVKDHFPEMIANDPYWKIVLVADFLADRKIVPLEERFASVQSRWIDQRHEQGKDPRIDPGHFERAKNNIRTVANELFQILNTTDIAFIETNKLNDPASAKRWERFLTKTRENKEETRARRHVAREIGNS
ncbi:MAG: HDIG domain-containing metalloprotein [Patescibacteria group bacterium]